jgi:hypothetical protein
MPTRVYDPPLGQDFLRGAFDEAERVTQFIRVTRETERHVDDPLRIVGGVS